MNYLLSKIDTPQDLRALPQAALVNVVKELRAFIINAVATKEGHLGASLGVVELTVALHYIFNTPTDPLIWDVGHQAYGHKILTGRRKNFKTNRQWQGISGFPVREESPYDSFGVGHSSTGVSAALGMALAAQTQNPLPEKVHLVVVGDAAIASGMAIEGLNHAGATKANLLVILNDNSMGIDPSVGALKKHFKDLNKTEKNQDRQSITRNTSHSQNFFTALGFSYTGGIDGHDLPALLKTLAVLKTKKGPRVLHIKTTKGKGMPLAEADQITYHAPGKFNALTGERAHSLSKGPAKYQEVFGKTLLELAHKFPELMAITPAMPTGSSLKYMMDAYPKRALDVGIAEQHAVTLAAGMATANKLPYCVVYSTFLQRAYDQVIHDVALQNLSVVFCIDRAGLVGQDGATHHGVFDLAFLLPIPNIILAAPSDEGQLRNLLYTAAQHFKIAPLGPFAIRYPRGAGVLAQWEKPFNLLPIGKGKVVQEGSKIAVLSLGPIKHEVQKAFALLEADSEIAALNQGAFGHYDMIFAKPLDTALLNQIIKQYSHIITIEDGVIQGGFGQTLAQYCQQYQGEKKLNNITHLGVANTFVPHGKTQVLYHSLGLDAPALAQNFKNLLLKHTLAFKPTD